MTTWQKPHTRLWGNAYKTFATLGVDATTQERLLQQIARTLPRPSLEDIERAQQESRAFRLYYAQKWQQEGKAIPASWLAEGDVAETT